jgi:trk system potassium uptake protein TrkA
MNILLVGECHNVRQLAKLLKLKNYNITVINENPDFCTSLADEYEVTAVCGNGTDQAVLQTANTQYADIVVALKYKDASNLLICEIAKKQFHVPKTIAFVSDPRNTKVFRELGVDRCVCTTDFLSDTIEQETLANNISQYIRIEDGRVIIFEAELDDKSPVLGCKLWEIGLPPQSIIGSIIRGKETIIPQGNTELKLFDKAVVISTSEAAESALNLLTGKKARK